jgi:hypothetical protein
MKEPYEIRWLGTVIYTHSRPHRLVANFAGKWAKLRAAHRTYILINRRCDERVGKDLPWLSFHPEAYGVDLPWGR